MSARQITLPFRARRIELETDPNADLIGRSYEQDDATITVVETCLNDSRRVMVERDIDGHVWSMPAWLMRLVFRETMRKRAA
ncbi:MAG TPA: hypothetical protein VK557_18270 [Pyrinomonadaceae bacterium]|nr:hypothetical protein [Pyrinomonadaceae bacterium]